MKRKVLNLAVVLSLLFSLVFSALVFAESERGIHAQDFQIHRMTLFASGEQLNTVPEGMLIEKDGTIYMDVESFFSLMGYRHKKYIDSQMILLFQNHHRVLFMAGLQVLNEIGSIYVKEDIPPVEGLENIGVNVEMTAPAVMANGVLYAPLSDVLRLFDIPYNYENYGIIELPALDGLGGYRTSREEVKNFARIVYYETRDSSMLKKTAVGGVIMNRVHSPAWPNTVNDVIFAHNQFPPAFYSGFSTLEPPAVQYEGAVRSLNGENNAPNCFFFNLVPFYGKEADFYKLIEGDYFYY